MTCRLVQPSSASALRVPSDRPESSLEVNPVRVLGDDYRRWSRPLVGLLGLALALFGVLATVTIPASGARLMPSDVSVVTYPAPAGSPNLVPGSVVAGVLLAAVTACLMGGVMRLVNAAAEADPL